MWFKELLTVFNVNCNVDKITVMRINVEQKFQGILRRNHLTINSHHVAKCNKTALTKGVECSGCTHEFRRKIVFLVYLFCSLCNGVDMELVGTEAPSEMLEKGHNTEVWGRTESQFRLSCHCKTHDPCYSLFLKFPKLPERAKNAASFGHYNDENLSASEGLAP